MTDKLLLTVTILTAVSTALLVFVFTTAPRGYFSNLDTNNLHTMQVWEDGSYRIVHHDNTSEVGCMPGGLCNE